MTSSIWSICATIQEKILFCIVVKHYPVWQKAASIWMYLWFGLLTIHRSPVWTSLITGRSNRHLWPLPVFCHTVTIKLNILILRAGGKISRNSFCFVFKYFLWWMSLIGCPWIWKFGKECSSFDVCNFSRKKLSKSWIFELKFFKLWKMVSLALNHLLQNQLWWKKIKFSEFFRRRTKFSRICEAFLGRSFKFVKRKMK